MSMAITFGVEVAIIQAGQILLTKRADLPVWCLPGGAIEAHESLAQAAIREAAEETGLAITLNRVVGVYSRPTWGQGAHAVLFAGEPMGGTLLTTTDETVEARFYAPDALPADLLWWLRQRIADAFTATTTVAWTQATTWPFGQASRAELYQQLQQGKLTIAEVVEQLCRLPTAGQAHLDVPGLPTKDKS
ncbi:MAG: NUDIX hydrolase [Caldilineaceae bacterium]|nr:NUDIX hydrolase [Caldilineaceae bacterium]